MQADEPYDDTYYAPQVTTSADDVRTLTFQTRILNQHLICTLCMGYFNDACTIIECLHTFCRVCIMKHFGESSFCPQCEKNLGPNPRDHVRTDRTLQSIVEKVFPQFSRQPGMSGTEAAGGTADEAVQRVAAEEAEAAAAAEIEAEDAAAAAASAAGGAPEDYGHEESAEPPRKRARPAAGAASSSDDAGSFADAAPAEDGGEADGEGAVPEEISFSLNELEGSAAATTPLEKPFLRTKSALTIAHLRKYLSRKMSLPPDMPIEFFCGEAQLDSGLTLAHIYETMWADEANDLVLHYRLG